MDFERIMEIADLNADAMTKEVELSTGDIIKVKQTLSVNDIRVIATMIATTSIKKLNDGEIIHRYDSSAGKITEIYSYIKFMTDIDVEGVDLDDLVDGLVSANMLEEIYSHFNPKLLETIESLAGSYIREEKRAQEVEGMLGYRIEGIMGDMDSQTEKTMEMAQELVDNKDFIENLKKKSKQ